MARQAHRLPQKHFPGIASIFQQFQATNHESISLLIVIVCTGGFLILTALHLFHVMSWSQALSVLGLSSYGVVHRLWLFQFLTAPLLHANLTHLAFNMLTLWMLGPDVERALGRRRYAGFSALCAGCAMLGFLLWDLGSGMIGYGYSGVIFGLLVAQAMFFPDRVLYIYAFFPLKMRHAVLVLGAVELYLTVTPDRSGIGHAAHLCGALGAWLYVQGTRWTQRMGRRTTSPKSMLPGPPSIRKHQTELPWEL
jgi:membrane associated rhomboid family serine protease